MQKYLDAWKKASDRVDELEKAAQGADETTTKKGALDALTGKTDVAMQAVATQRDRVEDLVEAKATQDAEAALWGERVTAAEQATSDAETAKNDAGTAVNTVKEQVTTRSWLFEVLNKIDATLYHADCNTSNPYCKYQEDATATDVGNNPGKSVWAWPEGNQCDISMGSKTCQMRGLTASSIKASGEDEETDKGGLR